MAQRRFHYDAAFEHYLRARRIPYVAVDEARKCLQGPSKLKNFDFVVYGRQSPNLLVDVKGRRYGGRSGRQLDNWVTREDVEDLLRWREVFGEGFRPAFVFLFWCDAQPPDALFREVFCHRERWYSMAAIDVAEYARFMKERSPKWGTVHLPASAFDRLSVPLEAMLGLEPADRQVPASTIPTPVCA